MSEEAVKSPLLENDSQAGLEQMWVEELHAACDYSDEEMPSSHTEVDFPMRIRKFMPKDASSLNGVVVIVHGLHSHSGRWTRVAGVLVEAGYGVYAPDLILHGRSTSDGLPVCDIPDFGIFVADIRALITKVSDDHAGVPLFLMGHSMGSAVTMHVMHDSAAMQSRVQAVIYSGMAIYPGASSSAPMGMKCLFCLVVGCCGPCVANCLASCGPMAGTLRFHCK